MLSAFSRAKRKSTVLTMFSVLLFCLFVYFSLSARFPIFLFAPVNLPIESKVWSRVARTNYMRTKQGYYMSSWTIPVLDPGEGPRSPHYFCPNWGPKGRKIFWGQPPPPPPLSEGLDSPLHSVTLTKWITILIFISFINENFFLLLQSYTRWGWQKKLKSEVECSLLAESPFRYWSPSPIIDHKKESTFF